MEAGDEPAIFLHTFLSFMDIVLEMRTLFERSVCPDVSSVCINKIYARKTTLGCF